jgi:flavin-dependent thymidylate synthase
MDCDNTVELIGVYGGDLEHALSAWTSTNRELSEEKRSRIPKLLTMLATEGHHTPFEKSALHFLVKTDIATHIQLLKHRVGVSINAESARYKQLKDVKYYIPTDWPVLMQEELIAHCLDSYSKYEEALKALMDAGYSRKRAKESARFYLPYANQIYADVQFNFRSFMHFQGLRNEEHAQVEIQDVAKKMLELARETGNFNESLKAFGY